MIKKLRRRIVMAAMFSLIAVLALIIGVISVFNYHSICVSADSTLEILSDNGGSFPKELTQTAEDSMANAEGDESSDSSSETDFEEPPAKPDEEGTDNEGSDAPDSGTAPEDQNNFSPRDNMSPELAYESRYFTVTLDSDGNVGTVNTGKIAAVDSATAISYAKEVASETDSNGFYGNYRYSVTESDGETLVIFLDCNRDLGSFYRFLYISIGVSAAGLAAVGILMIFLSGKIAKPFIENYEKQRRFITDAGHELKTPLAIINADSEVLEMDIDDYENEWISDIRTQTGRMLELTNNLIFLAKAEEDRPQTEMIDFPLSDIVEETVTSFSAMAKTNNRSLTSEITPMITINGDESSIRRLVTIFLDNAMKYSNEGGQIHVTLSATKNHAQLTVSNTCDHISKESTKHFFDRFYRADPSRNSKIKGYGLGLSIAKAIVDQHKGKISASTEDEKILVINVLLPM